MVLNKTKEFLEQALIAFSEYLGLNKNVLIIPESGQEYRYISSDWFDQSVQRLLAEFARAIRLTQLNSKHYFTHLKRICDRVITDANAKQLIAYMLRKITEAEEICTQEYQEELTNYALKLQDFKREQLNRFNYIWEYYTEKFNLDRIHERALERSLLEKSLPLLSLRVKELEHEKTLQIYQWVDQYFQTFPEPSNTEQNDLASRKQMFIKQTQLFTTRMHDSRFARDTVNQFSALSEEYYLQTLIQHQELNKEFNLVIDHYQQIDHATYSNKNTVYTTASTMQEGHVIKLEADLAANKSELETTKATFEALRKLTDDLEGKLEAVTAKNYELTLQRSVLITEIKRIHGTKSIKPPSDSITTTLTNQSPEKTIQAQQAYIDDLTAQIEKLKLAVSAQAARSLPLAVSGIRSNDNSLTLTNAIPTPDATPRNSL